MIFLYPNHELDRKVVDDLYSEEYNAARLQGHVCYFYDHDEFVSSGNLITNLPTTNVNTETIILRGYMLLVSQYTAFYSKLLSKGFKLINSPQEYRNCHYSSESYKHIQLLSVESVILNTWDEKSLQTVSDTFAGRDFIIKDFVKSAKDYPDIFRIKSGITGSDLKLITDKFIEHRGALFNDGLVFKEFVNFKKYGDDINEWRLFFYKKQLLSSSPNSNQGIDVQKPDDFIASKVSMIIPAIESNFFTIDVAELENGSWFIVETGDGQVSGLSPYQNSLTFYKPNHF